MKNVLVLSHKDDPHADVVCAYLEEQKRSYLRVNTEKFPKDCRFSFDSRNLVNSWGQAQLFAQISFVIKTIKKSFITRRLSLSFDMIKATRGFDFWFSCHNSIIKYWGKLLGSGSTICTNFFCSQNHLKKPFISRCLLLSFDMIQTTREFDFWFYCHNSIPVVEYCVCQLKFKCLSPTRFSPPGGNSSYTES